MINTQPYHHKLEVLQEWVNLKVDEKVPTMPALFSMVDGGNIEINRSGPFYVRTKAGTLMRLEEVKEFNLQFEPYNYFLIPMEFEEYYNHKTAS